MSAKGTLHHSLTFVVGFLVRPCCVVPAALATVGTGGAGVAAALAPLRPWLLLAAAGFFSVSFYLNFIRNRNRPGMVVWGVSMTIAAGLLLGPSASALVRTHEATADATRKETTMSSHPRTVEVPISGMACEACARRLEKVLKKTEGVHEARVDFSDRRALIRCETPPCDPERIGRAVGKAGFRADLERAVVTGDGS